jgi:hypothetical protein
VKKICILIVLLLAMGTLSGCEQVMQQVETIAQQVDVEGIVTAFVENVDWEELKSYAQQGYEVLIEHFPALKSENVKAFLKDNGLELLNRYIESGDETMQENARKLGEILKILNPELTDEVDAVIVK